MLPTKLKTRWDMLLAEIDSKAKYVWYTEWEYVSEIEQFLDNLSISDRDRIMNKLGNRDTIRIRAAARYLRNRPEGLL